jgi:hypothetical protein
MVFSNRTPFYTSPEESGNARVLGRGLGPLPGLFSSMADSGLG